jgi:hypothetical protein
MSAEELDIEVRKCVGLNQVNVEIWTRLSKRISGEDKLVYYIPSKIDFGDSGNGYKSLRVTYSTKTLQLKSFHSLFQSINFFNETLPQYRYIDMSPSIKKLEMLSTKAFELIQSWRKALEEVQVFLGSLEQEILDDVEFAERVLGLFESKPHSSSSTQSINFVNGTVFTGFSFSIPVDRTRFDTMVQTKSLMDAVGMKLKK